MAWLAETTAWTCCKKAAKIVSLKAWPESYLWIVWGRSHLLYPAPSFSAYGTRSVPSLDTRSWRKSSLVVRGSTARLYTRSQIRQVWATVSCFLSRFVPSCSTQHTIQRSNQQQELFQDTLLIIGTPTHFLESGSERIENHSPEGDVLELSLLLVCLIVKLICCNRQISWCLKMNLG